MENSKNYISLLGIIENWDKKYSFRVASQLKLKFKLKKTSHTSH